MRRRKSPPKTILMSSLSLRPTAGKPAFFPAPQDRPAAFDRPEYGRGDEVRNQAVAARIFSPPHPAPVLENRGQRLFARRTRGKRTMNRALGRTGLKHVYKRETIIRSASSPALSRPWISSSARTRWACTWPSPWARKSSPYSGRPVPQEISLYGRGAQSSPPCPALPAISPRVRT